MNHLLHGLFLVPSSWAEWKGWFRDGAPQLVGIIVGVVVVLFLLRSVTSRILHRAITRALGIRREDAEAIERRTNTLVLTINWLLSLFIVFVGLSLALDNLGLNVSALVASVGIVGIAIGLGSQTLIRDIINGTFILIEDQYRVGDVVTIAGVSGTVIEINPRRTVLRDGSGSVHSIPNSAITVATNQTQGFSRVNIDILVPYEADLSRAIAIIDSVCAEISVTRLHDILVQPRVQRVDAFQADGVVVRVSGDVRAGAQWAIAGEIRLEVKLRFDAEQLPFGSRKLPPPTHAAGEAGQVAPPPNV